MCLNTTLDALTHVGWPVLRQTHRPDCCIAATALSLAVLRQCGYANVRALTVRVSLANAAATTIMAAHPEGITAGLVNYWHAQRAKLVIIGADDAAMGRVRHATGRFVGHLVAVVPPCEPAPLGLLLDLSIGQAARPEYGLHVGPLVTVTSPEFLAGAGELGIQQADGSQISYKAFPAITSYAASPDWCQPQRIAAAVAATLGALAHSRND